MTLEDRVRAALRDHGGELPPGFEGRVLAALPAQRSRLLGRLRPALVTAVAAVAATIVVIALLVASRPPSVPEQPAGVASTPAPAAPDPVARTYPDRIPLAVDGKPVLRGDVMLQHAAASTDDTPFLVGGWIDEPLPLPCAPGPVLPDCYRWVFRDGPGGEEFGTALASASASGRIDARGRVVLEAHTHDRRSVECQPDVTFCQRLIVLDALVWTPSAATERAAKTVLLRLEETAGGAGGGSAHTRFVLYGDGLVLYQDRRWTVALRDVYHVAWLSDRQLDELMRFVAEGEDGGLSASDPLFEFPTRGPAGSTIVTATIGGSPRRVEYQLPIENLLRDADPSVAALRRVVERIARCGGDVAAGRAADGGTYDSAYHRVVLTRTFSRVSPTVRWPADLPFPPSVDADASRTVVIADAERALLGEDRFRWMEGPDGRIYEVDLQPARPEEWTR